MRFGTYLAVAADSLLKPMLMSGHVRVCYVTVGVLRYASVCKGKGVL